MNTGAFAVVVLVWAQALASCRTHEAKKVWVMPADLACETDDDCTIRDAELGCCCECYACRGGTEPFAISKRANVAWDRECEGEICTMDACPAAPGNRVEDFRAVCVNRACERRAKR